MFSEQALANPACNISENYCAHFYCPHLLHPPSLPGCHPDSYLHRQPYNLRGLIMKSLDLIELGYKVATIVVYALIGALVALGM